MNLHLVPTPIGGRRVWLGRVPSYEDLTGPVTWPKPHFILFLATEPPATSREARLQVAEHLIHAGAVYVCTWAEQQPN
jgi:hypothetical protein